MKKMLTLLSLSVLLGASGTACNYDGEPGQETKITEVEPWPGYQWQGAQKYYYSFDEKVYIEEVPGKAVLSFDKEYLSDIQQYLHGNEQISDVKLLEDAVFILTMGKPDIKALREEFSKQTGIKAVNPLYIFTGDHHPDEDIFIRLTGDITVLFKKGVSWQQIDDMNRKYPVEVEQDPNQHLFEENRRLLSVPVEVDVLEVANAYRESGLVVYSQPGFFVKINVI